MKFDELSEIAKNEALQNVIIEEGLDDNISDVIMDTYDSLRISFEKLGITGIKDAFENKSQKDVYDFDLTIHESPISRKLFDACMGTGDISEEDYQVYINDEDETNITPDKAFATLKDVTFDAAVDVNFTDVKIDSSSMDVYGERGSAFIDALIEAIGDVLQKVEDDETADVEQRENEMRDEIYKEAEDNAKNYDFDENGNIVK